MMVEVEWYWVENGSRVLQCRYFSSREKADRWIEKMEQKPIFELRDYFVNEDYYLENGRFVRR